MKVELGEFWGTFLRNVKKIYYYSIFWRKKEKLKMYFFREVIPHFVFLLTIKLIFKGAIKVSTLSAFRSFSCARLNINSINLLAFYH